MKNWIIGSAVLTSIIGAQGGEPAKCYQAEIAGVIDIVQTPATTGEKPTEPTDPKKPKEDPKDDPKEDDGKSTDADDDLGTRDSYPGRSSDIFGDDDRYSDKASDTPAKEKTAAKPAPINPIITQKARSFSLVEDLDTDTVEFRAVGGTLKFSAKYVGKGNHPTEPKKPDPKKPAPSALPKKSRNYSAEATATTAATTTTSSVVIREIPDTGKLVFELTTGSVPQGGTVCDECDRLEIKTTKTIVLAPVRCPRE